MTDTPPVPPEIVEKAAKAIARIFWEGRATNDDREFATTVLAAVYGDIVNPLLAEIERLTRNEERRGRIGRELAHRRAADHARAVEAARRDALTEAVERIRDWRVTDTYPASYGLRLAAEVVTDLRDATAPPRAPTATNEETR